LGFLGRITQWVKLKGYWRRWGWLEGLWGRLRSPVDFGQGHAGDRRADGRL